MKLLLEPVATSRAYESIVRQMRQHIAQGTLRPGDRLPPERELAAAMHVSRNTVREAFRILELSGLIQLRTGSNGGAFVIRGSSNAVVNGMRDAYFLGAISRVDLMEARISLGSAVLRIACEKISTEALAALEENVTAAEEAGRARQYDARAAIHREFHVLLAKATGNFIMIAMMEGIMEVTAHFVRSLRPTEQEHDNYTGESRRRLLKLLKERDVEGAVSEYESAIRGIYARASARAVKQTENEG